MYGLEEGKLQISSVWKNYPSASKYSTPLSNLDFSRCSHQVHRFVDEI